MTTTDPAVVDRINHRINDSQRDVQDHAYARLRAWGGGEDLVAHVATMRLYFRVPHMLTVWLAGDARRAVARALALHLLAMKLLDDVVDDDSGLDRIDLLQAYFRAQNESLRDLCALSADPAGLVDRLTDDLAVVTAGQVRTKREPAQDLPGWLAHAETYGGRFLALYGSLAADAGRRPDVEEPARAFGRAFGLVITIADDLRDYDRHGERSGNLRHLLVQGRVALAEAVALVEGLRREATAAVRAGDPGEDLGPLVDSYADEVVERLAQALAAGSAPA